MQWGNKEKRDKKGIETIFEVIMSENIPKLMTDMKTQFQEAHRVPSKTNIKKREKSKPRHVVFKLQKIKNKDKLLKEARTKLKPYLRRTRIKVASYFQSGTIQTRWEWIFKVLKEKKNYQSRNLYPEKSYFTSKGGNKDVLNENLMNQYIFPEILVRRSSSERSKMICVRKSDPYKERKNIWEGINKDCQGLNVPSENQVLPM